MISVASLGARLLLAAAVAPGLVLQPNQGPPNATVSITGRGWCASCGPVAVTFNGTSVTHDLGVDPNGTLRGTFTVPSGPAGWQRVVADQPGANRSATALFFVSPSQPGSPGPPPASDGSPSQSVTARGPTATATPRPTATQKPRTTTNGTRSSPPTEGATMSTQPPAARSAAPGAHGHSDGAEVWPWLAAAAVIAGAGALVAIMLRHRTRA
jgi:hypothetical protein